MRTSEDDPQGFFFSYVKNVDERLAGRFISFLKSTPVFPVEIPLLEIRYKYNSRKVQLCIATEGDGSTEPGDSYLSCFPYIYYNVSVRRIV